MPKGPRFYNNEDQVPANSEKRVAWLDAYADNLAKNPSLNMRLANQNKGATVDSVVKDYIKSTGLETYLKALKDGDSVTKVAQALPANLLSEVEDPGVRDQIMEKIKSLIEYYKGSISSTEVQNEVISIFEKQGISPEVIYNRNLKKYIQDLLDQEKQNHPVEEIVNVKMPYQSAGDTDPANTDFFHNMDPKDSSGLS